MTLTSHDALKLIGVHPTLVAKIDTLLMTMTTLGFSMCVTDGLRSTVQQQALYAQGRTAPGPIVTYADGVTTLSNHQAKPDGYGHAVDCCFLVNDEPSWDTRLPWKAYGANAEALGLTWGGDWNRLHDLPHVEMA